MIRRLSLFLNFEGDEYEEKLAKSILNNIMLVSSIYFIYAGIRYDMLFDIGYLFFSYCIVRYIIPAILGYLYFLVNQKVIKGVVIKKFSKTLKGVKFVIYAEIVFEYVFSFIVSSYVFRFFYFR